MGDSGRRRVSVRDVVNEDLKGCTDRGRYREYSDSPHNNLLRPRHDSRWSSREEKGDTIKKDKVGMAETRERFHNNGHYRSTSPGFDRSEQEKWSNTPDKQLRQSHKFGEKRRSRSRSRSRGLEKSRSRSPGWSRGSNPARDWSRSRSRSRSKGRIRGHSRSRSPFYDQGPESHQWSDRKNVRGRSSQTCKDFVSGMCRRGSQCKFSHSDNAVRDDEPLDSDVTDRWKGKQEVGHGSKYLYDKATDKFSDAHYGDKAPSQSRLRGAVMCRDFVKGNCRYGESCRFSHGVDDETVDRSVKNVPVDSEHGHNSSKAEITLCKFFLAGNCRRDSCRFSHDTPLSNEREDRIHDKSVGDTVGMLDDRKGTLWDEPEKPVKTRRISKWGASVDAETVGTLDEWKGTLRDEPEKPVKSKRISKWGASLDADMYLSEDVSAGRRGDDRWGQSLENENKFWEHDDNDLSRENYHSNIRTNDEDGRRMVAAEAMVIQTSLHEPPKNLTFKEFKSHNLDKLPPHSPDHNHVGEAGQHCLSSPSANPHVGMTSDTHLDLEMAGQNRGAVVEARVLHELKDCRSSIGQSFNPETRSSFCDSSSLLDMKGQPVLSPMSNALKDDLNESGQVVLPSKGNEQINQHLSTIQHMLEPVALSSFPIQAPNGQIAPLNTFPIPISDLQNIPAAPVAKSFVAELKTQLPPVPADCPQDVSNSTKSLDHDPLLKNGTFSPASDQKARELLSSLSMINPQLGTLHQIGDSRVESNDESKENLHEATQKLEVSNNGEKFNMSSQLEPENYCSNRADDQGKEEGGNNSKDEKVIRLFKNALVELVKDLLKPKWKEGKMSREVHKTVVKKVVDKVTVTIQAEHVPKTQEKIEQYLSSNKPKISKLVQAYVERSLKADS